MLCLVFMNTLFTIVENMCIVEKEAEYCFLSPKGRVHISSRPGENIDILRYST